MKKEIVNKISDLLEGEDLPAITTKLKQLKADFNEASMARVEASKKKFIDEGGAEEDFKPDHEEEDQQFGELMRAFNARKKKYDEDISKKEQENLAIKRDLLKDLKQLTESETNIGKAFQTLREIKEKWAEVGNVPKEQFKELQHDFSLQQEYFYYNIDIYKTLKEYDLEKNLQLKKELIQKVEKLMENSSIKEIRELIENYIKEWDEIGPTFKDKWTDVRDAFWGAAANVQKKIKDHYTGIKDQQKENLKLKQALCERVEAINKEELTSEKSWKRKTDEVLKIQDEWKKIGFATKKQNENIWKEFRGFLNEFFDRKKAFFKELSKEHEVFEKEKLKLIEQAESLKDSKDWKATTDAMVKLQRRWKQIGNAGQYKEPKLWKKFHHLCNTFFEAKKHYYDTFDDRLAENLTKKEAIVEKINAFKTSSDKAKDLEQLKALSVEWNEIGFVAKDQKSAAFEAFNAAMDKHYEKLKLEKDERENLKFENKVAGFKKAENAPDRLKKEKIRTQERIKKLEAEVVQYENNLGFFANAKSDNPLLKEVMDKIESSKKDIEKLRQQLQLLN